MTTDDPLAALTASGDRYKTAARERQEAREALDPIVAAAAHAGVPQSRIVELTGLTRETVRGIERRAGVADRREKRS